MVDVLVAIITSVVSLVGIIVTVTATNRQTLNAIERDSKVTDTAIEGGLDLVRKDVQNLSEKIDKMQSLYTRVTALERRADVAKERQRTADARINILEETCARKRSYKPVTEEPAAAALVN